MSDTAEGPGWWLASDGKWYPPEQWTGPPNTSPPGTSAPTGQTVAPAQPWQPSQSTTEPGAPVTAGQPAPTWQSGSPEQPGQPGVPGQPPAYGPNAWPGSAPPVQPPYGATPYGASPYGAAPYGQPVYVAPGGRSTNGLAIASFVCSILGIFFITFIVAIVLGFVARSQIRKSGGQQKGDGLAIAAIIIGFAWVAFYVLVIILGAIGSKSNTSVISLLGAIVHIA